MFDRSNQRDGPRTLKTKSFEEKSDLKRSVKESTMTRLSDKGLDAETWHFGCVGRNGGAR